jgi:hypothetical protein
VVFVLALPSAPSCSGAGSLAAATSSCSRRRCCGSTSARRGRFLMWTALAGGVLAVLIIVMRTFCPGPTRCARGCGCCSPRPASLRHRHRRRRDHHQPSADGSAGGVKRLPCRCAGRCWRCLLARERAAAQRLLHAGAFWAAWSGPAAPAKRWREASWSRRPANRRPAPPLPSPATASGGASCTCCSPARCGPAALP